jgi:hypothetical protein
MRALEFVSLVRRTGVAPDQNVEKWDRALLRVMDGSGRGPSVERA